MKRLEGKVAVITGAASGIGEATARLFVAEGARAVLADVDTTRGEAVAASLGDAAVFLRTDVSKEADVRAAVELATARFGTLDVMFNNAGIGGTIGPIAEIPVEEFDATLGVLLRGVFLGIKHAAPILCAKGSGSIVSTASVAGLRAGYAPHAYSVAKAGVIQLTRSTAMELGERGVRVNCICPGGIATPMLARGYTEGMGLEMSDEEAMTMVEQTLGMIQPIRRAGMPADVAHAALWLASDDSAFVSGHALVIDGALTGGVQWSLQPPGMRERRAMQL